MSGSPGPPGPLCFLVFVFSRPPAASDPPGRALNGGLKTLRPAHVHVKGYDGSASEPRLGKQAMARHAVASLFRACILLVAFMPHSFLAVMGADRDLPR